MSLSEKLRAARDERGLTLESASAKADIELRYARMFEDDDYAMVSDPAYLAGFVRRYAASVGLNELQASNDFIAEIVNGPVVMPNVTRRKPLGSPGGVRAGHRRPRRFKFYAGPLSVVAVLWIVGPLSPLNARIENTPSRVWVTEGREVPNHPASTSRALVPQQPPAAELPPAPIAPVVPPATVSVEAAEVAEVADAPPGDQELVATMSTEKSSPIVSPRSETDRASDALRAEQLERMKLRAGPDT